jgi:hypothetical protein
MVSKRWLGAIALQILGFLLLFVGVKIFFTNGGLGISMALMIVAIILIITSNYYKIKEKIIKENQG